MSLERLIGGREGIFVCLSASKTPGISLSTVAQGGFTIRSTMLPLQRAGQRPANGPRLRSPAGCADVQEQAVTGCMTSELTCSKPALAWAMHPIDIFAEERIDQAEGNYLVNQHGLPLHLS